jgi:hypothetical protein
MFARINSSWRARRALVGVLAGAALLLPLLAGAPAASAAGICVNPHGTGGCFSSINAAIAAATPGATITIRAGSYSENVVVDKSVTLQGQGSPTIYSAISNPNSGCLGTLCTPDSSIILVAADNVTVAGLTIDGDNPHLHSGVEVGGADIDARNGIITDVNHVTTMLNLVVRNNTVRNIYRRGIQVSSSGAPGSFVFDRNTVSNVQGDPNTAVAILSNGNGGNSGSMTNNTVSDSSDALSSNNSHGITFRSNTISRSGSGVHTDNAGDGGGTADVISENTVRNCTPGGYGIFTFVSYIAPTVSNNDITNCTIGLAVYGVANPVTPLFKGNTVRNNGGAGTIGALVTTDLSALGFTPYDVSATFINNEFRNSATDIQVVQDNGKTATASFDRTTVISGQTGVDVSAANVTLTNGCVAHTTVGLLARDGATLAAHGNDIVHNASFGARNSNTGNAPVIDAINNWWGDDEGPAPIGNGDRISAGVNATPFRHSAAENCGS